MVRLSVAKKWRFKELEYICEAASDQSQVTKIKCTIFSEFYWEKPQELEKIQGHVKTLKDGLMEVMSLKKTTSRLPER